MCDLQDIRRYTLARVSALSLSRYLLYYTTNETVAFICFTRYCARTYSHTLILIYVCYYYAANLNNIAHKSPHISITLSLI